MAEIKPNSNVYKEKQEEAVKKNVKPTAKTKLREKTFKEKIRDAFIADDVVDIKEYLIFKVAIPNIKKMFRNMLVGAIDMRFFGKTMSSTNDNTRSGATIVDYSRAYHSDSLEREYGTPPKQNHSVSVRDIDLVRFEKEEEAVDALRWLRAAIDDYGVATVSDFMDISGLQANNVHRKWGWFNLSSAAVKCDPDCDLYYIDFPPPRSINN